MDASFATWVLRRRIKQLGDKFDWGGFTANPKVTLAMVQANMDKPWNWACFGHFGLSYEVNDIPLEFYLTNGRKALLLGDVCIKYNRKVHIEHLIQFDGTDDDWYDFSSNPNFRFQNVLDYPDKSWDWEMISCHPNVTFDDIRSHIDLPWNWKSMSKNVNIRFEHVMAFPEKAWDWHNLSKNSGISVDDIVRTKDTHQWDWKAVSVNPTLKLHHVVENATRPWAWEMVVRHHAITLQDILAHDDLPWGSNGWYSVRYDINYNPNLTLEDIIKHPKLACKSPVCPDDVTYVEWQTCFMWQKKNFDINWILAFPKALLWNQYPASWQAGITWEDVKTHKNAGWCLRGLSMNPNVPIKSMFARKNKAWDWRAICKRADFLKPLDAHEAQLYFVTKKICRQLYESFTNPEYAMCRRRLTREFEKL